MKNEQNVDLNDMFQSVLDFLNWEADTACIISWKLLIKNLKRIIVSVLCSIQVCLNLLK